MGSYDLYFDSREEIYSVIDSGSDCSGDSRSPSARFDNSVLGSSWYEVWGGDLESVHDRRSRFLKWMGLSSDQNSATGELGNRCLEETQLGAERMTHNSGAVLMTSGSEDCSLSSQSSASSPSNEGRVTFDDSRLEDKLVIRNLDDGTEFVVDELDQDGMLSKLRIVGSNLSLSFEEFQRTLGLSPVIERLLSKYAEEVKVTAEVGKKVKESWLKKFSRVARSSDRPGTVDLQPKHVQLTAKATMQRVKVSPSRKRSKELSSLFAGQEFLAHKGSIWTMKFSLDGQYLASGGEDGIVRLWKVLEDERPDQFNILASDPSCPYCPLDDTSGSVPLNLEMEKLCKLKRQRSSDSTCTVFPTNVFKVLEKPLHEFQGHKAEILDLSWSKKRFLLSASADNTVRLWQVGYDGCLGLFSHTNYVTSVDFNPLDENYFISGSIDGKVRIWEVQNCQVAGYTDIKDIVTAVCYRPCGKGGLVGSVSGNCFFYNVIDNQLELDAHVCLQGKKKLPNSRITGFQFSPREPNKVVVTCADSVVRILCGTDVICKFKVSGLRITTNQINASFTRDGKHIVSMSDHSDVYIWNYNGQNCSRMKSIRSCESFSSQNALIAIPWSGIETTPEESVSPASGREPHVNKGENGQASHKILGDLDHKMDRSSPDWFSATRGLLLESLTRGSATWPEEKLPVLSPLTLSSTKYKSHYKLLKSACQNMLTSSHMWGLVIVTAGLDGRIRTYLNYGLPLRL